MPYDVGSGGALAGDVRVQLALAAEAVRLAHSLGVNHVELRPGAKEAAVSDEFEKSDALTLTWTSLRDGEGVWDRVTSDQHTAVRKSHRRGVRVRQAENLRDVDAFYDVLTTAFRAFGTPPYGRNYFHAVWQRFADRGQVRAVVAEAHGRCVGGAWMYCYGRTIVSKFAASLPSARDLRVFPALYHASIELGLEAEADSLSWGTSGPGQRGLVAFKERWAGESAPATIYSLGVRGKAPSIEKYYEEGGIARTVWRRLPLPATRLGGRLLSRWFC